jgi:hypothetical protein
MRIPRPETPHQRVHRLTLFLIDPTNRQPALSLEQSRYGEISRSRATQIL